MSKPASIQRRSRGRPPVDVDVEVVMDAAARVFATAGPVRATMDEIAESSGYSKPRLYDRFGSKEDLFEAVVLRETDRLVEHLLSAYAEVDESRPYEQLRRGFRAIVDFARANREGFRLVFGTSHPSSAGVDPLEKARRTIVRRIATMVRRNLERNRLPTGRTEKLFAHMIYGLGEQVARVCAADDSADADAVIELATAFTAAGFAGIDARLVGAVAATRSRR
ncbi:MAG: TetR/AcrR family transcriptional regulator [Candidatus Binatia bacterium]